MEFDKEFYLKHGVEILYNYYYNIHVRLYNPLIIENRYDSRYDSLMFTINEKIESHQKGNLNFGLIVGSNKKLMKRHREKFKYKSLRN